MINDHEHSWEPSYPYLSMLINHYDLKKGVELGVAAGRHSEYILNNTNVETLWSIDRWMHVESYDDPMNLSQETHDELFLYVVEKLKKFDQRSVIIRLDTEKAAEKFEDLSLDFVYVDADHSYEGCKRDLEAWIPKIKKGGFITGHDINFDAVSKAISETLPKFNMFNVMLIGDSCWAQQVS